MSREQRKKNANWKRIALIVTCVVLALVLVLLAVAGAALNYLDKSLDKMNYVTGDTTVSPEEASSMEMEEWESIDPSDTTPYIDATDVTFATLPSYPVVSGDHIVNIMMVGQDARPGQGTQRSDCMILLTFNRTTGEITLTSFLRDQYVQIPGYGATKLCHAYRYGGMTLLNQTLYNHYGVEIDGNVEVNFTGFSEIIDLLGGVEINLSQKEANYLNQKGGWNLEAGLNRLTGEQALRYSRVRHIDSDYQRTDRQRKVLLSLIEAYKDRPLVEMIGLLDQIMPLITTNIPKDDIYGYAVELFPLLADAEIGSQRLPKVGTFTDGKIKVAEGYLAACQYDVDFEANRKILEKIFDEIP